MHSTDLDQALDFWTPSYFVLLWFTSVFQIRINILFSPDIVQSMKILVVWT